MILNDLEFDVAKEFVNIGLAKAADSMSFFVRDKILITGYDVQLRKLNDIKYLTKKKGEDIVVLTTELRGEMGGVCFLVFDQEDTKTLCDVALPPSVKEDPIKAKEMSKAFLMELDNIVSAAVVTQFSNMLSSDIHGYVPIYNEYSEGVIEKELRDQIKMDSHLLYVKVNLILEEKSLSPEFIWALDEKFIEGVRAFVLDDKNASVIAKMKLKNE